MNIQEASTYFKIIADPNRLTILKELTTNLHMCASDFLKLVDCKQATLSHHLSELTESGLLNSKKSGNKVIYSLNVLKYNQLVYFLNRVDRINKNETKKPEEKPIRVVDTPLIKDNEYKKEELPDFLL